MVVLSEPGGGKTSLLKSLAARLGVVSVTANVFSFRGCSIENAPLVIDAFDELAKIDQSGINKLLANASFATPTHLIISSRSSEWDMAATQIYTDFLGHAPLVVKLCEFNEDEQRAIFSNYVPGESFENFRNEVAKFDLGGLLPNPQFLLLFADAYVESGRSFQNKRSIFAMAVDRLAKEVNSKAANKLNPASIADKVKAGSEVFAKILLSGAEGVTANEASENRIYPLLGSMLGRVRPVADILATRLFKPGDLIDQHRPVHKVVAEYCAAEYLTKRIVDPSDPLTLSRCLPIIAPNSTVRDELRGLLGWMAALGNRAIEEAVINLDPYAILANGDPSQLERSSKRLLIKKLKAVESKDPYFRRNDSWRRFSAVGFFTEDFIEEVRPLLKLSNDGHLRDLILELLVDSKAAGMLEKELQQILLAFDDSDNSRLLASRGLSSIEGRNHQADISCLISEASEISLRIAASIIEAIGASALSRSYLYSFFSACTALYPEADGYYERDIGSRYFIKQLICTLNGDLVTWLMDRLTEGLTCSCRKEYWECGCRTGISKVVGSLLDHYFELVDAPYNSSRIWGWLRDLNFHSHRTASQSKSVDILKRDVALREGILAHAFGSSYSRDDIFETRIQKFEFHSHSGLQLYREDELFLVQYAFEHDNPALWFSFLKGHHYHRSVDKQGPDNFRRYLRQQALAKPRFMKEWVVFNRAMAIAQSTSGMAKLRRRGMRGLKQRTKAAEARAKYFQDNRQLIEGGRHLGYLSRMADLTLIQPDRIREEFGDETIVKNALRNCLSFVAPHIPNLSKLAELQCSSQFVAAERILLASCAEIMRADHSLAEVDIALLPALRVHIDRSYSGLDRKLQGDLKSEIDKIIFQDADDMEVFLREYIEPQLENVFCARPDVFLMLNDDTFLMLRSKLSIEWLQKFSALNIDVLTALFDTAAELSDRGDLIRLIEIRCSEIEGQVSEPLASTESSHLKDFWYTRALYFLKDISSNLKAWIEGNGDLIHVFYQRSDRLGIYNHPAWPTLSASKVEMILNANVEKWAKVDLPSHWGTDSPHEENAYRFLTNLVWSLNTLDIDEALSVIPGLLSDERFSDMHKDLNSIYSGLTRKKALRDFLPPSPSDIVEFLDSGAIVTVESLRQAVVQELQNFQGAIDGGEFNTAQVFYDSGKRLDEVPASLIVAERLHLRLEPLGMSITPEHQMKDAKRSDFTVSKLVDGRRRLLVTEVKGQWHKELYSAPLTQLYARYSINPDAENQGIYIVLWYGEDELVANRKIHGITTAHELKASIERVLPQILVGLVDVVVLDVSKRQS